MKHVLEWAAVSEAGGRAVNEDSIGIAVHGDCRGFFLCDGLGGHGLGDLASGLVIKTMKAAFEKAFDGKRPNPQFLSAAFGEAQEVLLAKQAEIGRPQAGKTTAAAAVTDGRKLYVGHIGDSRVYIFNKGKIIRQTQDHSLVRMLAESGEISMSEIRRNPDRNILLRVMGTPWETPQYALMAPLPLVKCGAILLCSDGFWEYIEEDEMCRCLKEAPDAGTWLDRMTAIVRENGKGYEMDNYSAIAVMRHSGRGKPVISDKERL